MCVFYTGKKHFTELYSSASCEAFFAFDIVVNENLKVLSVKNDFKGCIVCLAINHRKWNDEFWYVETLDSDCSDAYKDDYGVSRWNVNK